MKVREALLIQAPSLALQRTASDEIARLDGEIASMAAQAEQSAAQAYLDGLADCRASIQDAVAEELKEWAGGVQGFQKPIRMAFEGLLIRLGVNTDGEEAGEDSIITQRMKEIF